MNENPYKRFKKAFKGKKPSGEEIHKMAISKNNVAMAMKKKSSRKEPTVNSGKEGDIEKKQAPHMRQTLKARKSSKRRKSVGMMGDVERKSTVGMKGDMRCKICDKKSKHTHAKKK